MSRVDECAEQPDAASTEPIINFTGSTVMNAMLFTFLTVDDHHSQICVDDVYYYRSAPLCLATASALLHIWGDGYQ